MKKVTVRGSPWAIAEVEDLHYLEEKVDGLCWAGDHTIEIEKNLKPRDKAEAILHEFLHAFWHEQGLDSGDIEPWVEHAVITPLAKELLLNKAFISYVLKMDRKSRAKGS